MRVHILSGIPKFVAVSAAVLSTFVCARGQTDHWQPRGENLLFQANSICFLPSGGMLAASPAGMFVSCDSGRTWSRRDGDIADTSINVMAVDNKGWVFAGSEHGLYRSTDQGVHWKSLMADDIPVRTLAFSSGGGMYAGTNDRGIFVSSDRGQTWTSLPSPPVPSLSLLVNECGYIFEAYGFDYQQSIQRSTNGGYDWTNVTTVLGGFSSLAEGTDHRLYAGKWREILVSKDSGNTWTGFSGYSLYETDVIALLPGSHGTFYAAGDANVVYLSTDDGVNWLSVSLGAQVSSIHTLIEDSAGNVYAGTNAGVFVSSDAGHSWNRDSSDFRSRAVHAFVMTPGGILFAGTDLGVYRSSNDGASWTQAVRMMPHGGVGMSNVLTLLYDRAGTLFALYQMGGVAGTTDEGRSWYWTPLADTTASCIELDTASALVSGDLWGGLVRSRDEGLHFQPLGTTPGWHSIRALRISPEGEIIVGSDYWGVFRSTDDGQTWRNAGLTQTYITVLLLLPRGAVMAGTEQGIFRWTDSLSGWQPKNNGMPTGEIWSLVRSPRGTIVAAGSAGVFYTEDDGENWFPLNDGLENTVVLSLVFDAKGDLLAGTTGGVYVKSSITGISSPSAAHPLEFSLSQNYPNPFNPSTRIRYSLKEKSNVTLSLYNTLGERVRILVSDTQAAGSYEVTFDASGLATGMYFYRLIAGQYVGVKRLVLIR